MGFKRMKGVVGRVYVPDGDGGAKKHRCGDCHFCQWCSEERCRLCRGCKARKAAEAPARRPGPSRRGEQ